MELTGDTNTPALPMTEAQVNHLRRLLAWMRCEWMLDENMQRGYLMGAAECVRLGIGTEERASQIVQEKADQINRCPAYVRQAVKMLTKALRDHERMSGVVESSEFKESDNYGFTKITDLVELPDGSVIHKGE
jgi:hypothetical protein